MADRKDDDKSPDMLKGQGDPNAAHPERDKDKAEMAATQPNPPGDKPAPPPANPPSDPQPKPNADVKAVDKSPDRKPRKVGPPKGESEMPVPADLFDRIKAAKTVEIVASDGVNEITGIPPIVPEGNTPWRVTGAGLALQNTDVEVHGPGYGQSGYQIAGYGLMLDGEMVSYRSRPDVINVAPNMTVSLKDDVVF